jgi:CHASE2 domain-containing sensor protein
MDALNTLRAVLVGLSFIAAVILAFDGQWIPAAVLFVGILAHFGLWGYLRAQKRRDAAAATTLEGIPAAER